MDWKTRIEAAFAAGSYVPAEDVIEELAQHARALYDTARADGCTHQEAVARVDREVDRWCADAPALRHRPRRPPIIEPPPVATASRFSGLAQDVRYGIRLLRRQPRFALLVSLTMALGICATTALFSVTYGVLIKPLPWPAAEDVVLLKETRGGNVPRFGVVGQFEDSRRLNQTSASPSPDSARKTGSIINRDAMSSVSRRTGPASATDASMIA